MTEFSKDHLLDGLGTIPCSRCGCTGIHACMGEKQEPWTEEDHARLDQAVETLRELERTNRAGQGEADGVG